MLWSRSEGKLLVQSVVGGGGGAAARGGVT